MQNVTNNGTATSQAEQELLVIQQRIDEASKQLKSLEDKISLKSKLGFFGEHIDFTDLFSDYQDSATTRNGLNRAEFTQFLNVIWYFNNAINGETKSIIMNGESVQLHDIPFDTRLKAILVPASVTYDVYNNEMHDLKEIDTTIECSVSLQGWIKLQQKFFRNWKNKQVDESNYLDSVIERATIQQVGRRVFFNKGGATLCSNYWRPEPGDIYQMPFHISVKLWDVNGDCIKYDEAVFRTFHAMYGRIVTN